MADTTAHALVVITSGSEGTARTIARHLVENRLVAGVQILPIGSVYAWEGEMVEDEEWLLLCKTRRNRYPEIEAAVVWLHPYEVVPIYMLPIGGGSRPYLQWIDDITSEPSD